MGRFDVQEQRRAIQEEHGARVCCARGPRLVFTVRQDRGARLQEEQWKGVVGLRIDLAAGRLLHFLIDMWVVCWTWGLPRRHTRIEYRGGVRRRRRQGHDWPDVRGSRVV